MFNKKGFTLMEVLVGIVIIAIVSMPLLQMFITSTKVGRRSYDIDKANTIAVETVEKLKADTGVIILDETGNYQQIDKYTYNWGSPTSLDYAFSVETDVIGCFSNGVGSAYIPKLVDSAGNTALLEFNYGLEDNYCFTILELPTVYQITCNYGMIRYDINTSKVVEIQKSYLLTNVLPIVIHDEQNTATPISINIDNLSSLEAGLYVFGDYDAVNPDNHLVTLTPLSGISSINYMKASGNDLKFDEYEINVKVIRYSDSSTIASYTTKVYAAS